MWFESIAYRIGCIRETMKSSIIPSFLVWRTENYGTAFNWSRVYCKRDKELSFGHVMFVTAVRHLSRDVKKAVGYLSVQFWDFCARRYKFENYQNICVYMYMHLYI